MKCLCLLLALTQVSVQLPQPGPLSKLVTRAHTVSPYSSSLKHLSQHSSSRLSRRQSQGSGSIIDNKRSKYLLPITFGTQTLNAELDTGSSDTWLIQTGFQCYETAIQSTNTFSSPEPASACNFGGTYSPDATFEPVDGFYQLSCYGTSAENTQRCVGGEIGVTSVTLCGLTVPQQLVGAPTRVSYTIP
jgi:hypothetical protein